MRKVDLMINNSSIIDVQRIKDIYLKFGDELSKYIFSNRLMYSLTGDMGYIRNLVCTNKFCKEIYQKIKSQEKIGISIFGCGLVGKSLIDVYDDIQFETFIDNNFHGGGV